MTAAEVPFIASRSKAGRRPIEARPVTGVKGPDPIMRVGQNLFYLGCFTLPMLAIRPFGDFTISDVIFIASASVALLPFMMRGRSVRSGLLINGACGLGLVGGLVAVTRGGSAVAGLLVLVRFLYLWSVWQWQARFLLDRAGLNRALNYFLVGSMISVLVAIAQFRYGAAPFGSGAVYGRAPGLTQHVNDQGGMLAVALALSSSRLIYRRPGRLVIDLLTVSMCGVGLVLSGSVTGMLAALAGIAALLVRNASPRTILYGMAVVIMSYVAGTLLQSYSPGGHGVSPLERLSLTTGAQGNDQNTLASRLESDRVGLDWISASPYFGRGLDPAVGLTDRKLPVHNFVLLIWAEGGLLLLAAAVIVVAKAGRIAISCGPALDPLREGLGASLVASLTYAMTAPVSYQRYFWLPVILLLAYEEQLVHRSPHG